MQEKNGKLRRRLNKCTKFAKELSDCKRLLKAAWFGNRLATFDAFPSIADAMPLGELTFAHFQLPLATLGIDSNELKPVKIRAPYDFLLPLEHGQRIVKFKHFFEIDDIYKSFTQISCFDLHGHFIRTKTLKCHVQSKHVAQCGPSEFVVYHESGSPQLSVYNSALERLRNTSCNRFLSICCNSKFVFGVWNSSAWSVEDKTVYTTQLIQVRHLDTLSQAFLLRLPEQYTIERILGDEHHVVALCPARNCHRRWFMCLIDLATCNKNEGGYQMDRVGLSENQFYIEMEWMWLDQVFLLDGWLVVPGTQEMLWFDKEGTQSDLSTAWDTTKLLAIYASRSVILFKFGDGTLRMKRLCHDGDIHSKCHF